MSKKWGVRGILLYILFGLLMFAYLFYWADHTIPESLRGSVADPSTFMTERELVLSEEYSKIRYLLSLLSTPYEWLFYLLVLVTGASLLMEKSAEKISKYHAVQSAVYVFYLSILSFIAIFPFQYLSHRFSVEYGISNQTFSAWMKDEMLDFWLGFLTTFIIVAAIYWLMKKSPKRWWLYAWLFFVPYATFFVFIQPIVIDPLYNDFMSLQDKELEKEILQLADQADIPAEHVYQVNMSEETNAMNAYVNGIGASSRIVLWDTTLQQLSKDEILVIMAHEMAHYVKKHLYFGLAGYLGLSLVGLWILSKLVKRWGEQYKDTLKISGWNRLSSLPLLFALLSFMLFAASPISNAVSRYSEASADQYALELTKDPDAAISTFQKLTKAGLSQVQPPLLIKWFYYTHPTMLERLIMIQDFRTSEN
ncbi:Zn-dependent protease with chaperone function [Bacillus oleivorans]|uniref:Zn-dependent protease with chaperone function n=1 Tax=Bacillus oleivorans TaxID=1448271 RepID=A0A285CRC6_9BACI|nr:M48 family metallopeptidase [Bacillus oleivorans]SNX70044.1 Zn-dependent protease with chaperone function [Bacillus oleivorans]